MPKDSLFPDDEPVGFQVWHKQGERYEHVATVDSNALGAVMLTMHGFMGHERWQDNPAVRAMPGGHRSTTIGDVLIGPDGRPLQLSADHGLSLKPIASVDRIPSDAKGTRPGPEETPLERVERQLRDLKHDNSPAFAADAGEIKKLRLLENQLDWTGVGDKDKEAVLAREVDFPGLAADHLNMILKGEDEDRHQFASPAAQRLFDEAYFDEAMKHVAHFGHDREWPPASVNTWQFIESAVAGRWPHEEVAADFGLDSQHHFEALSGPIRHGEIGTVALDAALGYGRKLTELARSAPSNPHKDIQFHTVWDDRLGRERPEEGAKTAKEPNATPDPSAAPPLRMNYAADCYAALMSELEAAADEFQRLARTPEQKALAKGFGEYVAGKAHSTIKYLTAEALRPDSVPAPDPFDRVVADLPRQWHHDGHAQRGGTWEELDTADKLGYLVGHAARHKVSFERLTDAAERTLGLAPGRLKVDQGGQLLVMYRDTLERHERSRAEPQRPAEGGAVTGAPQQSPDIRVLPGQDNPVYRGERTFDIHDATGKIGHLAGHTGYWNEEEFRLTHVEISQPGRSLTPGEWKGVLRGLRGQLPDAEFVGANRTGINGDLSPAYEKLVWLRGPEAPKELRPAAPDSAHRAQFQQPDDGKGLDR
jgi:hypothetical protein